MEALVVQILQLQLQAIHLLFYISRLCFRASGFQIGISIQFAQLYKQDGHLSQRSLNVRILKSY